MACLKWAKKTTSSMVVTEDADAYPANDNDVERWKKGEIELWACTYTGQLEKMTSETCNPEEQEPEPLKPHGLFATPESMDVINDWIERHEPEDRIHLYTLQGMYYNFIITNYDLTPKG